MSTPPSDRPRLPDSEKAAEGDQPDLAPAVGVPRRRIPEDEADARIPDAEE